MSDADGRWVATLSNGTTATELAGEWQIVPGERKPWVRLCQFCVDNSLHLTSLRLNFRGKTIHLPRDRFERFSMGEKSVAPSYYSLAYHLEADDVFSGAIESDLFVDLVAHYDGFEVHYIQDTTDGANSWVVVTQGWEPLAASPPK